MKHRQHTPKHCLHKPKGLGYVRLNGQCFYTGKWGTEEAHARYDQLIASWLANGRRVESEFENGDYRIRDLIADYMVHADQYYRKNGEPTKEIVNIRYALKPLLRLFGPLEVGEFGPRNLKALREDLIDQGLCRTLINQRIGIVKRVFTWAASEERVLGETAAALRSVPGLKFGRSRARETSPVLPVSESDFKAALSEMGTQVAAMAELQWLTGMRPGEVVQIRWGDIDREGEVWIYRPRSHKTQHHGKDRIVPLGPRAQALLSRFQSLDKETAIFVPAKEHPAGGKQYTVVTYRRAVSRACKRAGIVPWTPNRLRHSAATRIRRQYGLDVARALLGHSSHSVTEIYAELDISQACATMGEVG